jgi:hypothetical protein
VVYKRDGGVCQTPGCGQENKRKLTCHHKVPVSQDSSLFDDPENIELRCAGCHGMINKGTLVIIRGSQGKPLVHLLVTPNSLTWLQADGNKVLIWAPATKKRVWHGRLYTEDFVFPEAETVSEYQGSEEEVPCIQPRFLKARAVAGQRLLSLKNGAGKVVARLWVPLDLRSRRQAKHKVGQKHPRTTPRIQNAPFSSSAIHAQVAVRAS